VTSTLGIGTIIETGTDSYRLAQSTKLVNA
jgi:hypothetical protein